MIETCTLVDGEHIHVAVAALGVDLAGSTHQEFSPAKGVADKPNLNSLKDVVPGGGFEPPTRGFSIVQKRGQDGSEND